MKNKITKLIFGAIIGGLFIFNMLFSFNANKSATTLASMIITTTANAEAPDWSTCWWKGYEGGSGWFFFCQYDEVAITCTPCGSFM